MRCRICRIRSRPRSQRASSTILAFHKRRSFRSRFTTARSGPTRCLSRSESTTNPPTRPLFIPLPKALRCTLRLSVQPGRDALKLLGIWNWLSPAQQTATITVDGELTTLEKIALRGGHWMLTPWRNLELVHAVQRPLITPEISQLLIVREDDATFALPNFTATRSIASTDRIAPRASWNDPFEDAPADKLENRARIDHAFSVKITDAKSYAGTAA